MAWASAWRKFGRIDILVNNAGVVEPGVPEQASDEGFEQTIAVDLMGVWYATREVGRRQLADGRGGSVINIASICGMVGLSNRPPAYQAAKFAVIGLTKNLAISWGDRGVRVNAIAPGYFPSEMRGEILASPDFHSWTTSNAPLGRVGKVEELAGAVVFLASDASSYVTGHTMAVDGGWTAGGGAVPLPDSFMAALSDVLPDGRGKQIRPDAEIAISQRAAAAD